MLKMELEHAGDSDVGRKRGNNEDSWLVDPSQGLFVVADGMGGHESGEVASRLAVESLSSFFKQTAPTSDNTWPHVAVDSDVDLHDLDACRLVSAVQFAHRRIAWEMREHPELKGMGTTIVSVYFSGSRAYIAHVGDSRCYCFSDGHLCQITSDHTLAAQMRARMELLTERQRARIASLSHVVVRALGGSDGGDAQVDLSVLNPAVGDLFLLCSDGLTGELDDTEIRAILTAEGADLERACDRLIESANEKGGRDNITCLLVRVVDRSEGSTGELFFEGTSENSGEVDDDTIDEENLKQMALAALKEEDGRA